MIWERWKPLVGIGVPLLLLAGVLVVLWLWRGGAKAPALPRGEGAVGGEAVEGATSTEGRMRFGRMAAVPDWRELEVYQESITRGEFERLLTEVFTTCDAWRGFMDLDEEAVRVFTGGGGEEEPWFVLRFAPEEGADRVKRMWRAGAELGPAPAGRPLEGLRVVIDPGHLGGEWAKIEERWLLVPGGQPVREGDMTLDVALRLEVLLEELGAEVELTRRDSRPITPVRPEDLLEEAGAAEMSTDERLRFARRMFYRTAEIHARADLVNGKLRPDLVLCLHFNAEPWGDPARPVLVESSHFHVLLNGAYTAEEIRQEDQRFALMRKLLQRTHEEEARVGETVAEVFAAHSGLPAYSYPGGALHARKVGGSPFLWARNLLANRLYDCPVLFLEPYVMNSVMDHARIQAGDYEGMREIHGRNVPSIFREYAEGVAEGLARHYAAVRGVRAEGDGLETTNPGR